MKRTCLCQACCSFLTAFWTLVFCCFDFFLLNVRFLCRPCEKVWQPCFFIVFCSRVLLLCEWYPSVHGLWPIWRMVVTVMMQECNRPTCWRLDCRVNGKRRFWQPSWQRQATALFTWQSLCWCNDAQHQQDSHQQWICTSVGYTGERDSVMFCYVNFLLYTYCTVNAWQKCVTVFWYFMQTK